MVPIVVVLIGFGAGMFTMTIVNFYKWFLKKMRCKCKGNIRRKGEVLNDELTGAADRIH